MRSHSSDSTKQDKTTLLRATDLSFSFQTTRVQFPFRLSRAQHTVFDNLDFELHSGDILMLDGPNGSGKSTLLRLLAAIYPSKIFRLPTAIVHTHLQAGAGFHAEFSAADNLRFLAALFRQKSRPSQEQLQSIWDFAEIDRSLDEKLHGYSTGMLIRLALSASIHWKADLILIDELLDALDMRFRQKILDRLRLKSEEGCAICLSSHHPLSYKEFYNRRFSLL